MEKTLVSELGIGISAAVCFASKDFLEHIDPDDDDSTTVKEGSLVVVGVRPRERHLPHPRS